MNENLKRLMKQADYPAPELALRAQKLAELIVKECFTAIKNDDGYHLSVSTIDDRYNQGVQMGLEFAITDISEYFGVKE